MAGMSEVTRTTQRSIELTLARLGVLPGCLVSDSNGLGEHGCLCRARVRHEVAVRRGQTAQEDILEEGSVLERDTVKGCVALAGEAMVSVNYAFDDYRPEERR